MALSSCLALLIWLSTFVPLNSSHSAERQLVLRQGIRAAESSMAAYSGSLSSDGRFVAFVSMVDLLPADTRRAADIYVWDRERSTLALETPALHVAPSHGWSRHPRLSGEGRYLVFESEATDLVSNPASNQVTHIFVRDRLLSTTARVTNPDANHTSSAPAISDDGRIIAFESSATNQVGGLDANGFMRDVYVVRLGENALIRASVASQGRQSSEGESHSPSLSGDGRFLAFASTADLSTATDRHDRASRQSAIYVRDLVNGTTSCVSCIAALGNGSASQPHLSADARFVVFVWQVHRDRQHPDRTRTDIVLHDRNAATTTVITRRANASSTRPRMSANGRYAVFESMASNLACNERCGSGALDENLLTDIYLFNRLSGQFTRISGRPDEWWVPSVGVSIDRDGTLVSFSSRQPLDVNDPTIDFDLFVRTLTRRR